MTVRIKICGITRRADALAAADLGADAIGLVFAGQSPRRLAPGDAAEICRDLPPLVSRVGLFVDPEAEAVRAAMEQVGLNWLQFHGSEPVEFCRSFGLPYIKAVAMGTGGAPDYDAHPEAAALLLDSHSAGGSGGTGRAFDWDAVTPPARPWILAGGLDAGNVARAIATLAPAAVDVSTGVETSTGIKDHSRMREFIQAVRHA